MLCAKRIIKEPRISNNFVDLYLIRVADRRTPMPPGKPHCIGIIFQKEFISQTTPALFIATAELRKGPTPPEFATSPG
jgi:hypothetical protein